MKGVEKGTLDLSPDYLRVNDEVKRRGISSLGYHILPASEALRRFPKVASLWGHLGGGDSPGFVVLVERGVKVPLPLVACSVVKGEEQILHNLILVEEGASAAVVSGCMGANGFHWGLTEIFVEKGARLDYFSVHAWGSGVEVKPEILARVEGRFSSVYVNFVPGSGLRLMPRVEVKRGKASLKNYLRVEKGARMTVGGILHLEEAEGEVLTRAVVSDGELLVPSVLRARGKSLGRADCQVIQKAKGKVKAFPSLVSESPEAELIHEAHVGRLDPEKLAYLYTRGFSPEEAEEFLIKGFFAKAGLRF